MSVTLQEVEDALDSVPATDTVIVMHVREDGSLRRLADRDGVPNYPGHLIVMNDREEAATRLRAVSTASRPDPAPERGDQPTPDEPPRGRLA